MHTYCVPLWGWSWTAFPLWAFFLQRGGALPDGTANWLKSPGSFSTTVLVMGTGVPGVETGNPVASVAVVVVVLIVADSGDIVVISHC